MRYFTSKRWRSTISGMMCFWQKLAAQMWRSIARTFNQVIQGLLSPTLKFVQTFITRTV